MSSCRNWKPFCLLLVFCATVAVAQPDFQLLGIQYGNLPLIRLQPETGAGLSVGVPGTGALNSLAGHPAAGLFSVSGATLYSIDPGTGQATPRTTLTFGGPSVDVRALAFSPGGMLYAINDGGKVGDDEVSDKLYAVDITTGLGTLIGDTGYIGVQSLDFSPAGDLYGWEIGGGTGAGLVRINPATGAAVDVNPAISGRALDVQAIAFGPNGTLYGARSSFYSINPLVGSLGFIGSGGYTDIRGLAVVPEPTTYLLLLFGIAALLAAWPLNRD